MFAGGQLLLECVHKKDILDFLKISYITEKSLKLVNKKDGKDEPVEVITFREAKQKSSMTKNAIK